MCLILVEQFLGYLDYYSPILKAVITLIRIVKLIDIRITLNNRAKVSIITLDVVIRLKILVIYNLKMALRIIISSKSRFIRFTNNVLVIIRNTIVYTRFYIIDCPRIKIILGFLFFRKVRVIFRYSSNNKNGLVYVLF